MAPNPIGRTRRPRRRPTPAAASLPRDRLPVGTRGAHDPNASASHIQIIPRIDDDTLQSGREDNTPVHTNQSYLTEIDPGLDLHKRESHQRQHSAQTTFADMARAGVGPDHMAGGEFMVSQEPQPLTHFVRFKKKGKGRQWTPIDEETSSTRTSSPVNNVDEKLIQPRMALNHATVVGINPVDALRAHMDNVRTTFGRPLPDHSYLTANFGQRDREIQFVLHPNGDIHAHQWLAQTFEWQPVGQYVYMRKKLEGILSQEPLRGQKIGSFSPQNILQRFIAVSKQYEEASIAKTTEPKGYEPGAARSIIRPAIPLVTGHPQRPPLSMDPMSRSFSSAGYPSQPGGGLPTISNVPIRQPAPTRPRPPPVFGEDTYGAINDGRSSSPLRTYSAAGSPLAQRKHSTPELNNFPLSTRSSFGSLLLSHSLADSARSSFNGMAPPGPKAVFQERLQAPQGLGSQSQRPMIMEEDDSSDEAISPTATKNTMRETARSSYFDVADKTMPPPAMKKPAQPNPFASWTFTNHKRNSLSTQGVQITSTELGVYSGSGICHNPYAVAFTSTRASERPTSSVASEPRVALNQSEPEAGYSQRQCHVLTKLSTANMTNEELMMYSRPTPQDWKGPFFAGDVEDHRTEDEKLMDWWTSGNMSKRKNWTDVQGTYSSKYATPKAMSVPPFSGPPVGRQQAPIGTGFGIRGSAVEWKGSAARDVVKLGW